ncbi:MAG: GNAT family N-acetyltransferase [Eubacteriales bacterium]|nr:GNAT family N-acetyltransferase [Eubacteriales bacterium]
MSEELRRIRLLENKACLEAEPLWREVFWEDAKRFTDYYFSHKAEKNRGLVLEGEDGIRAMLYLTPEHMAVGENRADSVYLVGVATKEKYRHRGYMASLLKEAFRMLYQEQMPFVFLMPASPDIYAPFDFTYIYEKPVWEAESLRREKLQVLTERDADRMADFAQGFLKKEKSVYVWRDRAYYKEQIKELEAQEGCILGYAGDGGDLEGLCMYTNEGGSPEITEVLAGREAEAAFVTRGKETEPVIMARIVNLKSMLSLLRSEEETEFVLEVTDSLIGENNGRFLCRVKKDGAQITECREVRKADLQTGIAELTAIVFGYRKPQGEVFSKIRFLAPVWINEIV